jgi:hypothetical protein
LGAVNGIRFTTAFGLETIPHTRCFMGSTPSSASSAPAFDHSTELSRTDLQNLTDDVQILDSLKQAIASSSGFQSWKLERGASTTLKGLSLETLVRRYLRETLETLAY